MGYGGLSSSQGNSNAFYNLDESASDASDCFAYFGQEMLQLAKTNGVGGPYGVPHGAFLITSLTLTPLGVDRDDARALATSCAFEKAGCD